MTSTPSRTSAGINRPPRKPDPPVTNARFMGAIVRRKARAKREVSFAPPFGFRTGRWRLPCVYCARRQCEPTTGETWHVNPLGHVQKFAGFPPPPHWHVQKPPPPSASSAQAFPGHSALGVVIPVPPGLMPGVHGVPTPAARSLHAEIVTLTHSTSSAHNNTRAPLRSPVETCIEGTSKEWQCVSCESIA